MPLAIPDVHKPAPVKEPPNISKLWSEATEDDIENHALTIEVEKQPPEVPNDTKDSVDRDVEGLDLLKDDLSDLTPAPTAKESKEIVKTKAPDPHGIEALLGNDKPVQRDRDPAPIEPATDRSRSADDFSKSNNVDKTEHKAEHMDTEPAPQLTETAPPIKMDVVVPEEEPPQTPTELSRDNELLQFAKLVDKLHSDENSMDAEPVRPPSINLDLPESFASFVDNRRPDSMVTEDHSTMIHGLSPELKPVVEDVCLPEKVCESP